jgi:hypothetical protein
MYKIHELSSNVSANRAHDKSHEDQDQTRDIDHFSDYRII